MTKGGSFISHDVTHAHAHEQVIPPPLGRGRKNKWKNRRKRIKRSVEENLVEVEEEEIHYKIPIEGENHIVSI